MSTPSGSQDYSGHSVHSDFCVLFKAATLTKIVSEEALPDQFILLSFIIGIDVLDVSPS